MLVILVGVIDCSFITRFLLSDIEIFYFLLLCALVLNNSITGDPYPTGTLMLSDADAIGVT
jgi:hypothetical protein